MPGLRTIEMPKTGGVVLTRPDSVKTALPTQLLRKMEYCKSNIWSNCRGTALYLIGKRRFDEALEMDGFKEAHLADMAPLQAPAQYALVAWEYKEQVGHLGLVVALAPQLLVAHRICDLGGFFEGQPFSEVDADIKAFYASKQVSSEDLKVVFYLPKPA